MAVKVAIVSLGCAKNQVDSEVMLGILNRRAYEIVENPAEADLVIVNTCGFITAAKEESIQTILEIAQLKTKGSCRALIVAGCLAQKYKHELLAEIPELDAVMGTGEVEMVAAIADKVLGGERVEQVGTPEFIYSHEMPRVRLTPKYSAYVKVAEGCDNRCSFCVIPDLRGHYRSRTLESIVTEVKDLAAGGVKEIFLIAQDTTRYGLDLYGEFKLPELIRLLTPIHGIEWIRLLYCYPTHFTQELIEVMAAESKVCHYVDLPLQHADEQILHQMSRRGSVSEVEELINRLRRAMPDLCLRTTFIVGFPGETTAQFNNLMEFVARMRFDRVGVFTYSQEEGTPAGMRTDQIPQEIKEERYDRLMSLQSGISAEINRGFVGKIIRVLVEGKTGDPAQPYVGRSERDAPEIDGQVYFTGNELEIGQMVDVRVIEADTYDLIGEVVP